MWPVLHTASHRLLFALSRGHLAVSKASGLQWRAAPVHYSCACAKRPRKVGAQGILLLTVGGLQLCHVCLVAIGLPALERAQLGGDGPSVTSMCPLPVPPAPLDSGTTLPPPQLRCAGPSPVPLSTGTQFTEPCGWAVLPLQATLPGPRGHLVFWAPLPCSPTQ